MVAMKLFEIFGTQKDALAARTDVAAVGTTVKTIIGHFPVKRKEPGMCVALA
jgi:hypothetical protein